ncbi:protein of unknown function [Paraburkholderia fungorum]|uniref:DUF1845 domain-containing protein n=1 Tax=Paraburkholderia fungorum TaxID=134537 RepID=A0A1H1JYV4_9BURK|nr:AcaB family transcriptional regulator [Paraburkholderia fungorum]SDR54929.1 protein of unknown function [Paraburkholderia fungorum]
MAAVLDTPPEPDRPERSDDPKLKSVSGLKPIERLTSDTRVARIVPESDTATVLHYSSQFARDFIRSDYNFCAAKIAVARGGKVQALQSALRDASEWLRKTSEWIARHDARPIDMLPEKIELVITRPLAGLLVRCLTQYDRIFVGSIAAMLAEKITSTDRANILANAEKRIRHIVQICMPDNDQYDFDGERREK